MKTNDGSSSKSVNVNFVLNQYGQAMTSLSSSLLMTASTSIMLYFSMNCLHRVTIPPVDPPAWLVAAWQKRRHLGRMRNTRLVRLRFASLSLHFDLVFLRC